jgi:hypothetical protein
VSELDGKHDEEDDDDEEEEEESDSDGEEELKLFKKQEDKTEEMIAKAFSSDFVLHELSFKVWG